MSAPNSVIELAEARQAARANKDFALADSLRAQISAAGYEVADVAGGARTVVHGERLLERLREAGCNEAGHDVSGAARGKADDHAHRF